ncbi:NAD(P)H-binding protein [Pseudoclavibacter sp. VKM Ac-2867]|uniref:NAD(P)H-binding protein n=1 Tax=Pseudoclavibacter sp. VKM Ac-2867 TaxID=2783829 RepID=UPI00188D0F53|nr:NAD(P)H-binding protein [Pseudoclavibacter sp. VKM Ac-2867]MBF4458865.1 NAD(P)H-binding protein [Pseudoclavibacter sp. VKM Ac-2867]
MNVLVMGATGYIGSRVIPVLLDAGMEVTAGARKPGDLDAFWWAERVRRVELDVLDEASVASAVTGDVDAILYLVHGMASDDFREADLEAARLVRAAADRSGVRRIVYVSGIIPPVAEEVLSEHLTSRLEVERELHEADAVVVTLRAAMVLGASSTSFELMSQLAARLPVTVVPAWMQSDVEPIAVVDLARAVSGALTADVSTRAYSVGGGEQLPYPRLIDRYADTVEKRRPQVILPGLPESLVARLATLITDVPSSTVTSLMESLREDMVADDDTWIAELLPEDAERPLSVDEALRRSVAQPDLTVPASQRDPMGRLPGDPSWAAATD